MKKLSLIIFSLIGSYFSPIYAQDNYRSVASGNWNSASIWEKDNNGNGVFTSAATSPTSAVATITVRNGHSITISLPVSIDQTTVEVGATVNISNGSNLTVLNGTGTDLTINGILNDSGTLTISNSPTLALVNINGTLNNTGLITNASTTSLTFGANSVYNHQFTTSAGAIPVASWNTTSTCKITGYTTNTTPPTGLNQTFGNFEWNTPNLNLNNIFSLDGEPSNISGSLKILSVGPSINGNVLCLNSTSNNKTIQVRDSLIIDNESVLALNLDAAATTNLYASFFKIQHVNSSFILAGDGDGNLIVSENFEIVSGNISQGTSQNNSAIIFKNPINKIIFKNNIVLNDPIKYIVDSNSTLEIESNSFMSSIDSLIVNHGGTIILTSTSNQGAYSNSMLNGSIRVSRTKFNSGSKLVYGGLSTQYLGNGLPFNSEVIIRNTNGVLLNVNASIPAKLILDTGFINLSGYTLTIGNSTSIVGQIIANAGYIKGSGILARWFDTSNIVVGSNNGLFPFGVNADTTRYLWISGTPSVGGVIRVSHQNGFGTTAITPSYIDNSVTVNHRSNYNWTLTTSNGIQGGFGLRLRSGNIGGISTIAGLRISLANGIAAGSSLSGSGTLTQPEANRTGLTASNLSNTFYLATNSSQNPLPVKIISFDAKLSNQKLNLNWLVAQEKNIKEYRVMLSTDFKNWELIDRITDIKNSSTNNTYQREITTNITHFYIQLVAIDFNEMYTYSEIVNIGEENASIQISVFPNPIQKGETVNITSELGIKKITLLSLHGSELYTKETADEPNNYQFDTDGITAGVYLLKIITNQDIIIKRIQIK